LAGLLTEWPALGLVGLEYVHDSFGLRLLWRALSASLKRVCADHEEPMHRIGLSP
jgi:hypothetical protein